MTTISLTHQSNYVVMRDGVRLAVSSWFATDATNATPTVLLSTRYWRGLAYKYDQPNYQPFHRMACFFVARGYSVVIADARGSGASFGTRSAEIFPEEISDIGELINWVSEQHWCDGRVATTGTSYTANTTLASLITHPNALKLGVCRAPDFDWYRHLFAPGGIPNLWFIDVWGQWTAALDSNDVERLHEAGQLPAEQADNVISVRPVDEDKDRELLSAALAKHGENFNASSLLERMEFIDDGGINETGSHFYDTYLYRKSVEEGQIPVVIRCGWHDAATQLGALTFFKTFNSPSRIILGPWNHGGNFLADPFQSGNGEHPEEIPFETVHQLVVNSLDTRFKEDEHTGNSICAKGEFGVVEYFTLGENRWKTTDQWPLPNTDHKRLYLAADQKLIYKTPDHEAGSDEYKVNPATGTGLNNRWHTQMGRPIFFPDRQEEDKKLLVYDTPPLTADVEITGHPIVHLFVRSSATDGQFFVYLETIDPDGRVRMLTEGQLRGLHRKVSDETPPYKMFGPYHSLKKQDAQLMIPGEILELSFDLYPISVLLRKEQRIRIAIAGADKDVFAPISGCESPTVKVERNKLYPSHITLPIIS